MAWEFLVVVITNSCPVYQTYVLTNRRITMEIHGCFPHVVDMSLEDFKILDCFAMFVPVLPPLAIRRHHRKVFVIFFGAVTSHYIHRSFWGT